MKQRIKKHRARRMIRLEGSPIHLCTVCGGTGYDAIGSRDIMCRGTDTYVRRRLVPRQCPAYKSASPPICQKNYAVFLTPDRPGDPGPGPGVS